MAEYNNNQNPNQNNNQNPWQVDRQSSYSMPSQTPYQHVYTEPVKAKKRASGKYGLAALLVAVCMVVSLGAGFGGAAVANLITRENTSVTEQGSLDSSSEVEDHADTSSIITESKDQTSSSDVTYTDQSGSLSTVDVVKKAAGSVVEIVTETVSRDSMFGQYVTSGAGSGVIISEDGYIVTNHHVIDGATSLTVTLRNGTQYEAQLIASDASTDLAVLKVEATGLTVAVFADSDELQVGQTAIAIGNPLGSLGGSVTQGILSALDREITVDDNVMTLLQTDAAINPGNSGGGLFNDKGELIGVVNAKQTGEAIDGLGFAIPANLVHSVAEQLIAQGYVSGRISIGMNLIDIDDLYTAYYYGVSRTGVYVQSITGENAKASGLQTGDCIVSVADTAVSSVSEFNTAIKQYSVGDTVTLTVIRGNRQGTLELTLVEYTGEVQ